jgi:pyridoxal/pyridoxine/pyridoxamine kinase
MIRFLFYLALAAIVVYVATTVQLGKHTLVGHIRAIWHTEQVQDLKDGVKEKTAPAVDRLERGVNAGYKAATKDDGTKGSAEARP